MADLLSRVTFNRDQCGGKPCVRGMRTRLADVLGPLAAADATIASRTADIGAIIVTKDRDFPDIAASQQDLKVLWLRLGNVANAALMVRLEQVWEQIRADFSGRHIVELR